jgi:UDP:flavonoid glycosyltransferase YjiC (YdhE family)
MRLLFSVRPAYGHVYPVMPLALAARAAGHEVRFATTGPFLPKLAAVGFPTHDVGLTIEQARDDLVLTASLGRTPKGADGRPDLDFGGTLFIDVLGRRTAADLAPVLAAQRPDLVVYEQYEFGAAVAAHAAGIPAVCHSLSPRAPDEIIRAISGNRMERLWAECGVATPALDPFTGDAYLDIFPTALQLPGFLTHPARVPIRPIPYAEPGASMPEWVGRRNRPLVYLTLGTVVATDEVLLPAIEGLAVLDADVLVALGAATGEALGPLPGNVHVEGFVDQAAVLASSSLVVHHGGSGTVLGALTAGTPQLLLPKGADQFLNADLLAAAGLAAVLEPAQATADAVATMAKLELEERRPAADAARGELATMPAPAEVLDELVGRFS